MDNGSRDRTAEVARAAGATRRRRAAARLRPGLPRRDRRRARSGRRRLPRRRQQRRAGSADRDRGADPGGPGRPRDRLAQPRPPGARRAALARGARHAPLRRADEPADRLARDRPRPVPGDLGRGPAPARHARPQLRLDRRDAGQGRARGPARRRGAGRLPAAGGEEQGQRDPARDDRRGHEDHLHDPAPRRAARPTRVASRSCSASCSRPACSRGSCAPRRRPASAAPRLVRARVRRVPRRAGRVSRPVAARAPGLPGRGPRLARAARRRAAAPEQRHQPLRLGRTRAGARRQPLPLERPPRVAALGAAARRRLRRPQPQGLHRGLPAALRARDPGGRRASTTRSPR